MAEAPKRDKRTRNKNLHARSQSTKNLDIKKLDGKNIKHALEEIGEQEEEQFKSNHNEPK